MKKKWLRVLVAISMMIGIVPSMSASVFAEENSISDTGLMWEIVGDTLIVSVDDETKSLAIPDYSYTSGTLAPWQTEASGEIANNTTVKKIVIADGVTEIGKYAFAQFTALESATIGSNVTSIGDRSFGNCCNLESIRFLGDTYPNVNTNAFINIAAEGTMYVPSTQSASIPNNEGLQYLFEEDYGKKWNINNTLTDTSEDDVEYESTTSTYKVKTYGIGDVTTYYYVSDAWTTVKPSASGTYNVGFSIASNSSFAAFGSSTEVKTDTPAETLTVKEYVCELNGTGYETVQAAINEAANGQAVKMIANSKENIIVASGKNVTIDLNGKTLTNSGVTMGPYTSSTITIEETGVMTLKDSGTGGTITGNTKVKNGGGVYVKYGGTFNMESGIISGNSAKVSGGGVYNVGTFNMSGGIISGNSAKSEGGGVENEGKFTMTGGLITFNSASNKGGGVCNVDNPSRGKSAITVSGLSKITGNNDGADKNPVVSNIYLPKDKIISVGSIGLDLKAIFGVTLGADDGTGVVTNANSLDYHEYFVPDNEDLVSYNNKTSDTNQVVKFKALPSQTLNFANATVTKTYGDSKFTQTVSGANTAVTYESSNTQVATIDSATGEVTIKKTGSTTIKASATKTSEYKSAEATYTLTVNKAQVEVPTAVTGLIYNGTKQAGVILPQNAKYTLSNNETTSAGGYQATASLKDKDNYEWKLTAPSVEDQKIDYSISQKAVTVTANDKSMNLGEAVPTFTATVEGLVGTDTVQYTFNTINPDAQGVYSIVPAGDASQGNYTVNYKQGTLAVTKQNSDAKANAGDAAKVLEKYRNDSDYINKSLDIEVRTSSDVSDTDKNLIEANKPLDSKVIMIDAKLYLIINDGINTTEKDIGDENDQLIAIAYRFNFSNKTDIHVLRVHNGEVKEITATADNETGEYIVFDKQAGTITVYAKKYSTFAFAYQDTKPQSNIVADTGVKGNTALKLISLLSLSGIAATIILKKKKY